jgi:ribosomal protein S18 acetylase RimI-like enzyme
MLTALIYVHPDKPKPELWINEVGVAPSHQGQGIARRLLTATLDEARAAGCREAWVLTDQSNRAAMRLYESGGGEASGDHVMFTFHLIDGEPGAE